MEEGKGKRDQMTEQAKQVKEDVRANMQEATQTVKDQAADATEKVRSKASEWADQVKETGAEAQKQVESQVKSTFEQQKSQTADQVQNVAKALRSSSQELRSNDQAAIADYTDLFADRVEHFSDYVRSKSLNDLMQDVRTLAQRQPELFVAGTLAAGFLLGRLFKSSASRANNNQSSGYRERQRYAGGQRSYAGSYQERYQGRESSSPYEEYRPAYGSSTAPSQYGYGEYGTSPGDVEDRNEYNFGESAVRS